jgi:hypothetical protein
MTFHRPRRAALAERILELARGVLQAEYPPTPTPAPRAVRGLPGPPVLCSWDESMSCAELRAAGATVPS